MNYRAQVYAVFIFLVGGLLYFFPRPALPEVAVYHDSLRFDEIRAFYDLEHIAKTYPSRVTGSAAYEGAVDWVAAEFAEMGLEPVVESFATLGLRNTPPPESPTALGRLVNLGSVPGQERYWSTQGANITAVSPGTGSQGEAGDAVIVFAHLDTVPGTQGADDNASGVAAVLELARVFQAEDHRSAYAFVILAAEESGLGGAREWIARHLAEAGGPGDGAGGKPPSAGSILTVGGRSYGPVRLALGLDSVAWENGTLPAVYSLSSGSNRCEPGVVSIVKGVMLKQIPRWWGWRTRLRTQAAEELGAGGMSDHSAFLDAGVSSFCLGRCDLFGDLSLLTNSSRDVLDNTNSQILGRSGDLAEAILRTLEAQGPSLGITGRAVPYLFHFFGWTPGWMVTLAAALLAVFLAVVGVPYIERGARLRREVLWYLVMVVAACGLAAVSWSENGFLDEPAAVFCRWIALGVASLAVLTFARHYAGAGRDNGRVSDFLCLVLALWGVAGLWAVGPVWVLYTLLGPALAVPQFRGGWVLDKTLYRMVLVAWAVAWIWNLARSMAGGLPPSGFELFASRAWMIGLGLFIFPTVWQATARRGTADRNEREVALAHEPPVRLQFPTFRPAR